MQLASALGISRVSVTQWEGDTTAPDRDRVANLAEVLGVGSDWLLTGADDGFGNANAGPVKRSKPNASFPPKFDALTTNRTLPLLGQTAGGPNGKFLLNGSKIADVFCPPKLAGVPNAYAVMVYGTSMEPRYYPGETVWLNPQIPVRANDDVVIQLRPERDGDEMESYIKQFKSWSSKVLRLWQHNPGEGETNELEFDSNSVLSVHKIVHHETL
jgi:phage repressor protein C with HTH and peptisase S24 domain